MQSSTVALKEASSLPLATSLSNPDDAVGTAQLEHQQLIEQIPDEILQYFIFSVLDPKSLLFAVPQVCKKWRRACQQMKGVHLDLGSWFGNKVTPVEVLAGWRQTPMMLGGAGGGWATGLCALFPCVTSVTLGSKVYNHKYWIRDEHLVALAANYPRITHATIDCRYLLHDGVIAFADKNPGLTHVMLYQCNNLSDDTLIALGKKCRGITQIAFTNLDSPPELSAEAVSAFAGTCPGLTHADFNECSALTEAAPLALADKCSGLTHVDFSMIDEYDRWDLEQFLGFPSKCPGLKSITMTYTRACDDAFLSELADKCRGLESADFQCCRKVTDVGLVALANNCPELEHALFGGCENVTGAALMVLADKCRGLKHVDFSCSKDVTDTLLLAFADKCTGLEVVNFAGCSKLTDAGLIAFVDKCRGLKQANFQASRYGGQWGGSKSMFAAGTTAAVQQQYPNIQFLF